MTPGRAYKRTLDVLRSRPPLTRAIFGVRVHDRLIRYTWDVTTLVLKKAIDMRIPDSGLRVLDMGCGHVGLLAQYIKRTKQSNEVVGADIYPEFVDNAAKNAGANGLSITFLQSDLYESVAGAFDFILFNPPYVPLREDNRAFPLSAFSGTDGTDTLRRFLAESRGRLKDSGRILLGINCFHVPEARLKCIFESHAYHLEETIERRFNTARAFVLKPSD